MAQFPPAGDDIAAQLRAEPLVAGLRARQLRPCRGHYEDYEHLLILSAGSLSLDPGSDEVISAPAGVILPPDPGRILTLGAGSEGSLFGLAPRLLGEIMGSRPEMELMMALGRQMILSRNPDQPGPFDCEALSAAIHAELAQPAPGSRIAILAFLRLLIVALWRSSQQEAVLAGFGSEAHLIENFRREVEVNFRNHLSVAEYAARLGLSPTRLRRICQRNLDRSPLQLIHMRLMREAAAWLEHSAKSVAEIAASLGFTDSAEFSHFFKRNSGHSPSSFRMSLSRAAGKSTATDEAFADWP